MDYAHHADGITLAEANADHEPPGEKQTMGAEPQAPPAAAPSQTELPATNLAGCTVEAHGLGMRIGSRQIWEGLTFTLHPGTMTVLTGPSGCGKSTLLNCIGLLETPTAGTLTIDGTDTRKMKAHARRMFRLHKLGYMFQDYALIDNATVADNISLAQLGTPRRQRRSEAEAALAYVGLSGRGKERIYTMSGGEQQRVALARLLVKKPGLILADEPTGALDEANALMVVNGLRQLANRGATVILATHSPQVAQSCDTVIDLGNQGAAHSTGDAVAQEQGAQMHGAHEEHGARGHGANQG